MTSEYQIFVLIRFSLHTTKGFYKKMDIKDLYSEERMNIRFDLFEKICLPSLRLQAETINVVLLVSDVMPLKYLNKLRSYTDINVCILSSTDDFSDNRIVLKNMNNVDNYKYIVTVKLDDDDALHPSFSTKIKHYINTSDVNMLTLVSFINGCQYNMIRDECCECSVKSIACGLTLISPLNFVRNVYYEPYSNGTVQFKSLIRLKVIFDETKLMYMLTNHNHNHSLRGKWDNKSKMNYKLWESMKQNFPFL